jgi:Zn-finger nucleic acid-binding protein
MRSYERNRVLVDQCTGCGGLFLDRGELEALVAAENAWHQQSAPPQDSTGDPRAAQPAYQQQAYQQPPVQQPPVQQYPPAPYSTHSGGTHYGQRPRRRKSFLSELFDD